MSHVRLVRCSSFTVLAACWIAAAANAQSDDDHPERA